MNPNAFLIVDDSEAELVLISRLVENAFPGSVVTTAPNAMTAEKVCSQARFDCVILDYNMPERDGLICAHNLRESFPYMPIVMCTSFGDEMLAAHAVMNGVTDYIPKSRMTVQALSRVVVNALKLTYQARTIEDQRNELEDFAYALAHDFRQPIRQIKTFSTLLAEALRGGGEAGVEQHLAFLKEAARRLGDLVDVMSQYTLLGKSPEIGDIDLGSVLTGVLDSLAPYIEDCGGEVTYEGTTMVLGNETFICQVFHNLIINGLKYNKSKVPTVRINVESEAKRCVVKVRDNGIGIEPQYYEEIFKPLTRLHTNAEYSGSGLGLALARKALGRMRGTITCSSEMGVGTEFTVDLPLAVEASYRYA